ncbi:MAG: response regulator, partial [Treponema sp.]|nr:response regulator [Treponema sp.]
TDSKDYFENASVNGRIRYTFPRAQLLVVDDIATNLKVAEGLMAPYRARVDTCLNGLEAIEQAKRKNYDIIFMDHMMPEMDGIEATAAIRAWENNSGQSRRIPIIALTANAVSGMREMFIEKGFDDFLAKPIDVSKMNEALIRWLPKEKREERDTEQEEPEKGNADSLIIPGVNIQHGISMTGGTLASYKQVLALFRKDAQDRLRLLHTVPSADALPAFVTQVHALKSASASLGAMEISEEAARLEAAGKIADINFIKKHLDSFANRLAELALNIGGVLEAASISVDDAPLPLSDAALLLLNELGSALKSQDASVIDRILEELMQQPLDSKTKEAVEKISDDELMAEFGSAIKATEELARS